MHLHLNPQTALTLQPRWAPKPDDAVWSLGDRRYRDLGATIHFWCTTLHSENATDKGNCADGWCVLYTRSKLSTIHLLIVILCQNPEGHRRLYKCTTEKCLVRLIDMPLNSSNTTSVHILAAWMQAGTLITHFCSICLAHASVLWYALQDQDPSLEHYSIQCLNRVVTSVRGGPPDERGPLAVGTRLGPYERT